jgi:hypothetical protein
MAIYGAKNWNLKARDGSSIFFAQTRSCFEHVLYADHIAQYSDGDFVKALETCSMHSAVNALLACFPGDPESIVVGPPGGSAQIRLPDYLMAYVNTPSHFQEFSTILPGVDLSKVEVNEYRQIIPYAMRQVFGSPAVAVQGHTKDSVIGLLKQGKALEVGLVHPKHFVAILAYDDQSDEFIYCDPDDRRHPDGNWQNARCKYGEGDGNWTDIIIVHG